MAYVFRGGIYFGENKNTRRTKIERILPSERLRIPMLEHAGVPAIPAVSVGDNVLRGEVIGNPDGEYSCAVHSPVSGTVTAIGEMILPDGRCSAFIEIENDSQYTVFPTVKKCEKRLAECESDEIISFVRRAGICDTMDGVPADVKLSSAVGKVEYCIINCVFDEPYVNGECRLVYENPAAVINGLKIILKALRLRRGIIAIGENNPEIIKKLHSLLKKDKLVGVSTVRAKYPGGNPRELLYSVMGRELTEADTPLLAGCVIFSALTAANIYSAFASGMPFVSRVVSVDGDCISHPVNILAPIGTSFSEIVSFAGGLKKEAACIISGGPLRGDECDSLDCVITKSTSAIIVLSKNELDDYSQPPSCIRCGRCMSVCPMRISPSRIYKFITEGKHDKAIREGALFCEGCGACSYICPGKVPVAESVRRFRSEYEKQASEEEAENDE